MKSYLPLKKGVSNKIYTIGTMSGTSGDGVDVALVLTDGDKYLKQIDTIFKPYSSNIRRLIDKSSHILAKDLMQLERDITEVHANAIKSIINNNLDRYPSFIGIHGQTIFHDPIEHSTMQIINPHEILRQINIPVLFDFRRGDMTRGGQGAPLASFAHLALAKSIAPDDKMIFLNVGGISNVTICNTNSDSVAFDCGSGCVLWDRLSDSLTNKGLKYDYKALEDISRKGKPPQNLIAKITDFYNALSGNTIDRSNFDFLMPDLFSATMEDALAFSAFAVGLGIKSTLKRLNMDRVEVFLVCGGGRRNSVIMQSLQETCAEFGNPRISEEFGIDGDFLEATAFGYLAARVVKGFSTGSPEITHAKTKSSCASIAINTTEYD